MGDIAGPGTAKLFDILNERLTFERAGVEPYDRVLTVSLIPGR